MKIIEAFDKDNNIVGWSGIPESWKYNEYETEIIYKRQMERERGIKIDHIKIS